MEYNICQAIEHLGVNPPMFYAYMRGLRIEPEHRGHVRILTEKQVEEIGRSIRGSATRGSDHKKKTKPEKPKKTGRKIKTTNHTITEIPDDGDPYNDPEFKDIPRKVIFNPYGEMLDYFGYKTPEIYRFVRFYQNQSLIKEYNLFNLRDFVKKIGPGNTCVAALFETFDVIAYKGEKIADMHADLLEHSIDIQKQHGNETLSRFLSIYKSLYAGKKCTDVGQNYILLKEAKAMAISDAKAAQKISARYTLSSSSGV